MTSEEPRTQEWCTCGRERADDDVRAHYPLAAPGEGEGHPYRSTVISSETPGLTEAQIALWAGLGNHGVPERWELTAIEFFETLIASEARAPLEEQLAAVTAERDENAQKARSLEAQWQAAWTSLETAERQRDEALARWQPLADEIDRARAKYPGNEFRLLALQGEVNEVLHAFATHDAEKVHAEVLQVAATAMRLYEEGDSALTPPASID